MAIPNAMQVESGYLIFDLVPSFFQFAAETILVYTFARTALQPLVQVRGYAKARGVALGLTIPFGLVVAADWISDAVVLGLELNTISHVGALNSSHVAFTEQFEETTVAAGILQLTYTVMSITWGLAFMGMSIHALRKSRNALESRFRAVPQLMVGASIIWIIRSATIVILNLFFGIASLGSSSHAFVYLELAPILSAIVVNVLLLVIFVLFLLAFRPHLASMYVDGALAEPLDSQTNDVYYQEHYQPQETYQNQNAHHHQTAYHVQGAAPHEKASNESSLKMDRPHSSDPGMEAAHNNGSYV
jgi:hypothetical protein